MSILKWDEAGKRLYETGVNKGVLYPQNSLGLYPLGVAWNGLIGVSENPSGAEPSPFYADNIKYLNLMSTEEFGATIEAFTYPDEFAACDGSKEIAGGASIGQQKRSIFGLCYKTILGNDILGEDYGYKIHLIYGALAAPTSKGFQTVNESPDAIKLSWEISTTAVEVTGFKPTASLVVDSTKVSAANLAALEAVLYGTESTDPSLPTPDEVIALITDVAVVPTVPTFVAATGVITIPTLTGVIYSVDGVVATAGAQDPVTGGETAVVTAAADAGYFIEPDETVSWSFLSELAEG